jgi:hypothetical protein
MIIAVILVGGILFVIFFLLRMTPIIRRMTPGVRHHKAGRTGEGRVHRYTDLMTNRGITIISKRNAQTRAHTNEAYYDDRDSPCERALLRHTYGYLYYENGQLRAVTKSFALDLLRRIREVKVDSRGKGQKFGDDIPE